MMVRENLRHPLSGKSAEAVGRARGHPLAEEREFAGYTDTNPKNYFVEYAAITNETHLYPEDFARNAFSYGGVLIELIE